jgi:phosphatidylglycerophosphate synthase
MCRPLLRVRKGVVLAKTLDPTIKELKESKAYKKPGDRLYKKIFIRPISVYFAWLFLRLGLSANDATLVSLVMGIFGSLFLLYTEPIMWVFGWLFFQLYNIFDSSDGQIARYSKTVTTRGDKMDLSAHVLVEISIFIAMTIGLYKIFGDPIVIVAGISSALFMVLFHFIHFMRKKILRPDGRKSEESTITPKRGINHLPFYKKISNTTNMIINSVLFTAVLDVFFIIPLYGFTIQPINFRLILLMGCGLVFPLIFVKKLLGLRKQLIASL